jgi:crotonobetainyl-CoA:carnitine CoA-transferase CaiB-like acyl-CoA transferase
MGPRDHHADPHLRYRSAIVQLDHPEVGDERHVGNPIRLSRLPQRTAASAPCLGAHTEDVLTTVLGLASDEVATLVDQGVCH